MKWVWTTILHVCICVFDSELFNSGSTTVCRWGCHHLRACMSGLFYILYIYIYMYIYICIYVYYIPRPSKYPQTLFYPLIVPFFGGGWMVWISLYLERIEWDLFSSHGSQQTSNAETSPCNCDLYRWSLSTSGLSGFPIRAVLRTSPWVDLHVRAAVGARRFATDLRSVIWQVYSIRVYLDIFRQFPIHVLDTFWIILKLLQLPDGKLRI